MIPAQKVVRTVWLATNQPQVRGCQHAVYRTTLSGLFCRALRQLVVFAGKKPIAPLLSS